MKKLVLLLAATLTAISFFAQNSMLVVCNDNGYFVKNGDNWRHFSEGGGIYLYTQYGSDANFYMLHDDHSANLAIPKKATDAVFYLNGRNEWVRYKTVKKIYNYFDKKGGALFLYPSGYFVKNGNDWEQVYPDKKQAIWCTTTQTGEDNDWYYTRYTDGNYEIAIPKHANKAFFFRETGAAAWIECERITDILNWQHDPQATAGSLLFDALMNMLEGK